MVENMPILCMFFFVEKKGVTIKEDRRDELSLTFVLGARGARYFGVGHRAPTCLKKTDSSLRPLKNSSSRNRKAVF